MLSRSNLFRSRVLSSHVHVGVARSLGVLVFGFASCVHGQSLSTEQSDPDWVRSTLKAMTLEDKVGQMIQIRGYGDYRTSTSSDFIQLQNEILHYHVGSIDLGARMRGPNLVKGSPMQVAGIMNELQKRSPIPLLIGADLERGLASRLSYVPDFPYPMAFGAAGQISLVKEFGRTTAQEARAVGIQWAFAPVADVNNNPKNPIINTRSFGEDPTEAAQMVAAYIEGAHEGGMLTTAKHFPGEGDTATDPHARSTVIAASLDHLEHEEFLPFSAAIKSGTDAVMLAQAAAPALDPDPGKVSATSEKIVTGSLRTELGFHGLVITDALEMRGLASLYPGDPNPEGRIAVDAIRAGVDMVTLPSNLDATFHAILRAVQEGVIPEARIDQSVRRILEAKVKVGLDKQKFVNLEEVRKISEEKAAYEEAQQASDAAITLVRNANGQVPLNAAGTPHGTTTVAILFTDSAMSPLGKTFERELLAKDPSIRVMHLYNDELGSDADPAQVQAAVTDATTVLLAVFSTHTAARKVVVNGHPVATVGFAGAGAELLKDVLSKAPRKSVVIAFGSPYLISDFPETQGYICTYSLAKTAEISAVKALYGHLHNKASLPVSLPGIAKRGFSIPWPSDEAQ